MKLFLALLRDDSHPRGSPLLDARNCFEHDGALGFACREGWEYIQHRIQTYDIVYILYNYVVYDIVWAHSEAGPIPNLGETGQASANECQYPAFHDLVCPQPAKNKRHENISLNTNHHYQTYHVQYRIRYRMRYRIIQYRIRYRIRYEMMLYRIIYRIRYRTL